MVCLNFIPLIVLLLGIGLGDAFPSDALKKTCRLSKYRSLVPHVLEAVQKMQQQFVSTTDSESLWAGGRQGRWGATLKTLSAKADVFRSCLRMRRIFSKGVWGQGCWAEFCPGVKPLKADWGCRTPRSQDDSISFCFGLCLQEDDILLLSDRKCHTLLFHRRKSLVTAELSVRAS